TAVQAVFPVVCHKLMLYSVNGESGISNTIPKTTNDGSKTTGSIIITCNIFHLQVNILIISVSVWCCPGNYLSTEIGDGYSHTRLICKRVQRSLLAVFKFPPGLHGYSPAH